MDLVLIWIFSCCLAWAMTGSTTSMGDTLGTDGFRRTVRIIALVVSLTAILTSIALAPTFTVAISLAGLQSLTAMASLSFLLWAFFHLSGAVYSVWAVSTRLVNHTL